MRQVIRFGWAAAVGLAVGGTAVGQTTGTGTSTGTGSTGSGSTSSGLGGDSSGGTGTAVSGSLATPSTISAQTATTGNTTSGALDQSNNLGAYYANPFYQGKAGATNQTAPGGFGTTLYGTNGSGSGGGIGTGTGGSSRTTGTAGRTSTATSNQFTSTSNQFTSTSASTGRGGSLGGTTGVGGTGSNGSAQVIALPRQIAYTASVRFATRPMTAPRMQTEVRAVLDRSVSLSNARGITVTTDGQVVALRGVVKDEDEARLVEGMVRLSPGVRDVRNELTFPTTVAAAGP